MGSKGSQTTTTSSSANPAAMSAYYNLLNQAGNVASTPYQAYSGELVAGVNPQEYSGIGNINQYATAGIPGLTTAENMLQQSGQPLTASQIQQYYNPYQQDVIGSTEQQFNQQNQIQQNQTLAGQAAQGALGGTGTAVAQSLLAGQQQQSEAPVIAGLEQQGYNTAEQTAAQQFQQNPQAAAYGLASTAGALEQAGIAGGQAQIGAGSLEQQTQQALDTANYQQWENQQAYPFQTTQWLAGIDTGVGSEMGGTSSTTGPSPSLLSQLSGSLLGGAGILGGTGAFGSAGWLAALMARGGAVKTVPESRETLMAQQRHLVDGHRSVQFFPSGTAELPLPDGLKRVALRDGIYHYNPKNVSEAQIRSFAARHRENEMLDLGPYSKEQILHRVRGGEAPLAVVERDHDGTELRSAAGTHVTAPHQIASMAHNRTGQIAIEDPRETLARRAIGGVAPLHRAIGGVAPLHRAIGGVAPLHRAMGGGSTMFPQFGGGYGVPTTPYAQGSSYVPGIGITKGRGPPPPPRLQQPDNSANQMWQQASKLAGTFKGMTGNNATAGVGPIGTSPEVANIINQPTGSYISDNALQNRGGRVIPFRKGGGRLTRAGMGLASFVPHFDSGGGANDNETDIPEQITPAQAVNARWADMPVPAAMYGSDPTANIIKLQALGQMNQAPQGSIAPQGPSEAFAPEDAPQGMPAMPGAPPAPVGGVGPAMASSGPMAVAPPSPPQGGPSSAPAQGGIAPTGANGDRWGAGADIWPTLIAAGAGMLASRSPFPGVGIGEGLQAGLGEMGELQASHLAQAKEAREEKTSQQDIDLKVRELDQQAKSEQDKLAMEAKQLAETAGYHSAELAKPFAVGTDINTGQPIYAVRDPSAPNGVRRIDLQGHTPGVIPPADTATAPAQTGLGDKPAAVSPETPTGVHSEILTTLDPQMASQVKALDEGRMQFPSGFALKSPYWQNMLRLVSQYDPSFDAVNYNARSRARQDFTSGKSAQNITSFNTAIGHLGTLDASIDGLGNTRFGWLNPALQAGKSAIGDTQFQEAQKQFAAARQAVTDELTRAFRGSGGNVHDIVGWEQTLNAADSPQAMHAAVRAAVDLLRSRIESVGDQYNRGMGTTRDPLTLLSPHAQSTIDRLSGQGGPSPSAGATSTKPAAVIQNGHTYTLGPDGNYH